MKIVREDLGSFEPQHISTGLGSWRWQKKLPLSCAPGVLRVGFFGCGSAFSSYQHQSNLLILKGKTRLFVDAGTKFISRLAEFGLSAQDVDSLVVTHSHADHCGSVEEVGLKWRYETPSARRGARPRLYIPESYATTLWEESLRGGMAYSEEPGPTPGGFLALSDFFEVAQVKAVTLAGRQAWQFSVGEGGDKLSLTLYTVPHLPEVARTSGKSFFSVGLIIDGKALYSGDTRFDPEVFEAMGKGCDTFFHDCQSFTGGVHASYEELKTLPKQVRERMFLYHCDDNLRPLNPQGKLGGRDVRSDGFAGFAEPMPLFYEW